ncbi:glycosyltransferase involved in cell wall biosynthesis [Flavobacterium sp. 103]|uniref:glycosyltransferase family 4 protein n=1 Tax=Flavobacterium sp. 103 TaxID=2135624 RepID=UPI000D5FA477|nr:glycosyltransferase family 4 protein [Flavobacterium sp. 103]PVX46616.1 glycosyltransferase involved in cell wall biosynthesis [Flavobacterium sp. 103]
MKILIISHDATRTGAPILLLNLAKLLLKFKEYEVTFLLKNGGVLESDFSSIAATYFVKKQKHKNVFWDYLKIKKRVIEDKEFLNNFDLIISNTITNGEILEIIRENYKGKIISYIHELEIGAKAFSNENNILKLIKNSTNFWVPSSIVNDFLIDKFDISQDKIFMMPYYIPYDASDLKVEKKSQKEFVVGGCGTIDWRKGADLFIVVANQLFIKYPNSTIIFRWAGAFPGIELERLNYELRKCKLEGKVFFEFSSSNINEFYNSIDLFLLPSREDPYPLVILEAAKFNVPSICFDLVCGSKDFIVNSKGGIVVPFLDIDRTVEAIISFYSDPHYKKKLGKNANDYLMSTHSNDKYVYGIFKELLGK